jgi:hypothetical protein
MDLERDDTPTTPMFNIVVKRLRDGKEQSLQVRHRITVIDLFELVGDLFQQQVRRLFLGERELNGSSNLLMVGLSEESRLWVMDDPTWPKRSNKFYFVGGK